MREAQHAAYQPGQLVKTRKVAGFQRGRRAVPPQGATQAAPPGENRFAPEQVRASESAGNERIKTT